MVATVHDEGRGADRLGEQGVGRDPQRVAPALVAVVDGTGTLARQVLIERPAQRDVQDLDAAADREDRLGLGPGLADQRELDRVARRVHLAEGGVRRRPVAGRRDVLAPGQHQPIQRA